jgi:O-antigen ligase
MLDLAPEGLAVPGFAQTLDLSAVLALLLAGGAAVYVLANRIDVFRIPLVLPFGALLGVAMASLMASSDPGVTLASLARLLGQLAVYVLVFSVVRGRAQVQRFVVALVASALLPVLWGFGQILSGHGEFLGPVMAAGISHPRLGGPMGSGLTFGTFLLIPLVLVVVLLLEGRRTEGRVISGCLLLLYLTAFYFTLARAAWLAFALAVAILALTRYRALMLAAPLALVALLVLVPGISQRWTPVVQHPNQTTLAGRLKLWHDAWTVFEEHPILGAGFGIADVEASAPTGDTPVPVHSDYLRVLADLGLLGLAAYLWLVVGAGVEGLRALGRLSVPFYRAIALSFLTVWVGFMIVRVSGNVLTHQVFQYSFWALAAVTLALPRLEAAEKDVTASVSRN